MAVTKTTDGSLTAVTVAETKIGCQPTDNDRRSKQSMRTEAMEPDHP